MTAIASPESGSPVVASASAPKYRTISYVCQRCGSIDRELWPFHPQFSDCEIPLICGECWKEKREGMETVGHAPKVVTSSRLDRIIGKDDLGAEDRQRKPRSMKKVGQKEPEE